MKLLDRFFGGLSGRADVELHGPETCPHCGSLLARNREVQEAEISWLCPNPDCPPQVLKRVALWASPEAMDIKGCDAALVAQLVNRGLVHDAAEFYRLKLKELEALPGMDKESAQKFFDAITASMKREAWRVLFGLGIPHIGAAEAQTLCRHFATLDDLFATGRERLLKRDGVTEIMAHSVMHWYGDPVNRKLIQRLEKVGVNFSSKLAGPGERT